MPSARRVLTAVVLLALAGVAGWQGWERASAWANLRRGRAALDRDDPPEARRRFDRALAARPDDPEAHFLAARAARKDHDPRAAVDHLKEARRLGWPGDQVDAERTLADLGAGTVDEPALLRLVAAGHPDAPDALAALVPGYMAAYRLAEADTLSKTWVELRPESADAWRLRADILVRLGWRAEARDAAREAVRVAPHDRAVRVRLARLLLDTNQPPDEVAGVLGPVVEAAPDDAEALLLLAAARRDQGKADEAAALVGPLTAGPNPNPRALLLRGKLLLDEGKADDALPFLRRAVERDPFEPEPLFTLARGLRQAGRAEEAAAAEEQWKRTAADVTRASVLGRAIAASPNDPELRREIGELYLRNGKEVDGVRWLESAVRVRPDYAPAHKLLADHYDRTGPPEKAAAHRAAAGPAP